MPTLALDTTTRAGSGALVDGIRVVAERPGDATRSHGERLPGELIRLLDECRVPLTDIGLFAVAAGPGSFTGLRIGIATVQGLATVLGRPIVAVSALDALGHAAASELAPGSIVGACMDAQRGDVFAALYRVVDAPVFTPDRLVPLEPPSVGGPADVAARWVAMSEGSPIFLIGDGVARHREVLESPGRTVLETPLLAGIVGRLAGVLAARGAATAPMAVRPLYVRRPDALIARDRLGP
jgi:tRNA threonylcarbamoyladenosine biosynthesis protein TsaB